MKNTPGLRRFLRAVGSASVLAALWAAAGAPIYSGF